MLGGKRFFRFRVDSLSKAFTSRASRRNSEVSSQSGENVVIPPRIERGPTDILKALASTVGPDYTAFHYKYPDDPYLYPYTEEKKQIYALSLESGRKSASWIFKNNPGFFKNQLSEPPIKEFLVKSVSSAESEPTEETLLNAIEERDVKKAIEVYKTLEKKDCDVSESTKQCLLELTCYYSSNERTYQDLEEKWFLRESWKEDTKNYWMNKSFAEELFKKMDSSCPLANSAIIQGMFKNDEITLAQQYYEAAKVKKVKLSVGVYNMLLLTAPGVSSGVQAVKFVKETFTEMAEKNIRPNVGTLNATLAFLLNCKYFKEMINFTKNVIGEFRRLGIEPSLGSYGYLFRILSFWKFSRESNYPLALSLMDYIEHKNFEITHASDLKFFQNAATAFTYNFGDPDLSVRLLKMLLRNNNSKFVASFADQTDLFKNIFIVIIKKKPIDFAMDVYRNFALTTYSPSAKIFQALILATGEHNAPEYLVELWEDSEKLLLHRSRTVLREVLRLVRTFSDESCLKIFHSAAISFVSAMKAEDYLTEKADVFSNILIAFVKNDDEENIGNFLKNLKQENVEVNLDHDAAKALYDYALAGQKIPLLVESLQIAASIKLPTVSELASEALPLLDSNSKAWVLELINKEKEEDKSNPSTEVVLE